MTKNRFQDLNVEGKKNLMIVTMNNFCQWLLLVPSVRKNNEGGPIAPAMLFNKQRFVVSFYDCEGDVLLMSEPLKLLQSSGNEYSVDMLIIPYLIANFK